MPFGHDNWGGFAMRPKLLVLAFATAALTLVVVATVALGDDRSRARATLTGYEETPSTLSSPGRGEFRATINDEKQEINYTLTFSGLTAVQAAHIHLGQRATTGGVSAFLCGGGGQATCPTSAGTVTGTITPAQVIGPTTQGITAGQWDELVAAMRAGFTYANVHTTEFATGEIRGQISTRGGRNDGDDDD
jgi:hypothetical protein